MRTGYLDALAARTLGVAPLLRPVTPSRFEPDGLVGPLEVLEVTEPLPAAPPTAPIQVSAPQATEPAALAVHPDAPLLPAVEPDASFGDTARTSQVEVPHESESPLAAESDTAPVGIAALARAVAEHDASARDGAQVATAVEASRQHSAARREQRSAVQEMVEPSGTTLAPPPVVVHIGRIDVRAADPAPRPVVAPRQPPVQAGRSLADHLLLRDRELS